MYTLLKHSFLGSRDIPTQTQIISGLATSSGGRLIDPAWVWGGLALEPGCHCSPLGTHSASKAPATQRDQRLPTLEMINPHPQIHMQWLHGPDAGQKYLLALFGLESTWIDGFDFIKKKNQPPPKTCRNCAFKLGSHCWSFHTCRTVKSHPSMVLSQA